MAGWMEIWNLWETFYSKTPIMSPHQNALSLLFKLHGMGYVPLALNMLIITYLSFMLCETTQAWMVFFRLYAKARCFHNQGGGSPTDFPILAVDCCNTPRVTTSPFNVSLINIALYWPVSLGGETFLEKRFLHHISFSDNELNSALWDVKTLKKP